MTEESGTTTGLSTPVEVVTLGGTRYPMFLPHAEHDAIQHQVRETGRPYEEEMLTALAARCSGGTVVDVGANIGNHTLYLLHVTDARVVAVEPDAELVGWIERSAAAGGMGDRLITHAVAVSDAPGIAGLSDRDEGNIGQQHLVADSEAARVVEVVTLDSLDLRDVEVLKVDVEGLEAAVLRGARRLLAEQHPVVYVECLTSAEFDEVEKLLSELGYVYSGTFNATPTHCFEPASEAVPEQGRRAVREAVRHFYTSYEAALRLRESHRDAARKYREATRRIDDLKAQVTRGGGDARTESVTALVEQNTALLRQYQRLADGISAVHRDLTGQHEDRAVRIARLESELAAASTELASTRERLVREQAAREGLQADLDALEAAKDRALARVELQRKDFRALREWVAVAQERHRALEAERDEAVAARDAMVADRDALVQAEAAKVTAAEQRAAAARQAVEEQGRRLVVERLARAAQDRRTAEIEAALKAQRAQIQQVTARARAAEEARAALAERTVELEQVREAHRALQQELTRKDEAAAAEADRRERGARAEVDELRARAEAAEEHARAAREELKNVRASATFQTGKALREARRMGGAVRLPARLVKAARASSGAAAAAPGAQDRGTSGEAR